MEKNSLGLPLEYSTLHEYFDALSTDNADAKNQLIEEVLRKYKVNTVLDLTCGTGSQVFWLAKQGYKVTGADLSPDLLNITREKAHKENIEVRLIEGDMRTLHVGSFDAVITIFNAIGHLTKTDFEKTLRNIHSNLKDGGLYVFDIFNLQAMTDTVVHDLAMDVRKTVNDTQIHHIQKSEIDRKSGRLTSYDHYTLQKSADTLKTLTGEFTLQIYTAQELREMLSKNGFETLEQLDMDGSPFLEDKTLNILTVAKRQECL